MGKKLAIQGHDTRGDEVIELLEMMGGTNPFSKGMVIGNKTTNCYYISEDTATKYISWDCIGPEEINEYEIFTLEEFLKKYPYRVGDKVHIYVQNDDIDGRYDIEVAEITSMRWNPARCKIAYKMKNINREFYKEEIKCKAEESMEDKKLFGTVDNSIEAKSCTVSLKGGEAIDNSIDSVQFIQSGKIVAVRFNTQNYENEVELQLDDYEIEIRNGKTYAICKKPKYKYPTTYEECCKILDYNGDYFLTTYDNNGNPSVIDDILKSVNVLTKLLICRDAYWKVVGEQMELGKPWEPDWKNGTETKYTIVYSCSMILNGTTNLENKILAFPTKEMRDAFYENFKDLIDSCKELL